MRVTLSGGGDSLSCRVARLNQRSELAVVGLEGWFGTASPNAEAEAVPGGDGAFMPLSLTSAARTVTLSVAGRFRSSVECAEVRDRLLAICSGEMDIEVSDAAGPRRSRCYASDAVEPAMFADERGFSCDIVLTCPDPVKRGDPVRFAASGGRIAAFNEGNAPVWPRIEASGTSSLRLELDGHVVSWSGSGALSLDFADMRPSAGAVAADDAFRIPPGRCSVSVEADAGASVAMVVEPGWR